MSAQTGILETGSVDFGATALLARERDKTQVERIRRYEIHREPQARKRLGLFAVCQTDLPSFRTFRI